MPERKVAEKGERRGWGQPPASRLRGLFGVTSGSLGCVRTCSSPAFKVRIGENGRSGAVRLSLDSGRAFLRTDQKILVHSRIWRITLIACVQCLPPSWEDFGKQRTAWGFVLF